MPEIERWVIGEAVLGMLSASRAMPSARSRRSTDLWMNELHPSKRIGILIAKGTKLTADLIRGVQRILSSAKGQDEVSFEFAGANSLPPLLRGVRGLYITADRITPYEGTKLPKEAKGRDLADLLPPANSAVAKALQEIVSACLGRMSRSRSEFTQEDIWRRLMSQIKRALDSIGMRENVHYHMAPYLEDVGAAVAFALRDSCEMRASLVDVLRPIMLGKSPWVIHVTDASADYAAIVCIYDGGEDDYRH
jgi:hypothetical protein